ncbi:MAG: hypothetical protein M3N54_05025 [Acidobacteriota bacterium]|nr:hypothetical protein [Acidobacteriota bacterium]
MSQTSQLRNEITGQLTVMNPEDRLHHDQFCLGIVACLKPATALETQLAYSIGVDYWRLNRVHAIEEGIFALSDSNPPGESEITDSQTQTFLDHQAALKFLSQYEMRIQRILTRNKAELRQMQDERLQPGPEQSQPEENGFAFSAQPKPAQPAPDAPAPARTAAPRNEAAAQGFGFSNPATPRQSPGPRANSV